MNNQRSIAILGCGPAGLLAAHAVAILGHKPTILSTKQPSVIQGAQYLHDEIPFLSGSYRDGMLTYIKLGTKAGYARKVYGRPEAPCSWDGFPEGSYPAWSMRRIYAHLWLRYKDDITDCVIRPSDITNIVSEFAQTISTVPAKSICATPGHLFPSARVWIAGHSFPWGWVDDDGALDLEELRDNWVVYDGREETLPYRISQIFGAGSAEFGTEVSGAQAGIKPLWTNCDCHSGLIRAGRFGRWEKGILVHHSFRQTLETVNSAFGRGPGALL